MLGCWKSHNEIHQVHLLIYFITSQIYKHLDEARLVPSLALVTMLTCLIFAFLHSFSLTLVGILQNISGFIAHPLALECTHTL